MSPTVVIRMLGQNFANPKTPKGDITFRSSPKATFFSLYPELKFFHQGLRRHNFSGRRLLVHKSIDFILCGRSLIVRKCQTVVISFDIFSMFQLIVLRNHWLDFSDQDFILTISLFAQLLDGNFDWFSSSRQNPESPRMPKCSLFYLIPLFKHVFLQNYNPHLFHPRMNWKFPPSWIVLFRKQSIVFLQCNHKSTRYKFNIDSSGFSTPVSREPRIPFLF